MDSLIKPLSKTIVVCLLMLVTKASAQTTFQKTYGEMYDDFGYAITQLNDGGYVIGGIAINVVNQPQNYYIRLDANGDTLWTRRLGNYKADAIYDIVKTADGGFIMTGKHGSIAMKNLFVAKFDLAGNVEWKREYNQVFLWEEGRSIRQTPDGGYIIAGAVGNGIPINMMLLKINATGAVVWQKYFEAGPTAETLGYMAEPTHDGGYIITGYSKLLNHIPAQNPDTIYSLTVKTDSVGNVLWKRTLYAGIIKTTGVQENADGTFMIAGYSNFYGPTYDAVLVKLSATGNVLWRKTYINNTGDEFINSFTATADGGFALTGYTNSFGGGNNDYLLLKVDSAGVVQWTKSYGANLPNEAEKVVQTADGGYAIIGSSVGLAHMRNLWLVKTDANGNSCANTFDGIVTENTGTIADTNLFRQGSYQLDTIRMGTEPGYTRTFVDSICSSSCTISAMITGPTEFCEGDSVLLIAESAQSYVWQPGGQTTQSIYVDEGGDYSVTVTDANGCSATSSPLQVVMHPAPTPPVVWVSNDTLVSNMPTGNTWYMVGNPLPISTEQRHFAEMGYYYNVYTDSNGCTVISDTVQVKFLGVDELTIRPELMVYPNPGNNITYEIKNVQGAVSITLNNNLGQVVYAYNTNVYGYLKHAITGNFAPGIYYLTVQTKQTVVNRKIEIIQ